MKNKLRFILKSGLYYKQLFWLPKSAVYNRERFQIKNRLHWRAYGILLRNLRSVIEDWKAFQSWFCIYLTFFRNSVSALLNDNLITFRRFGKSEVGVVGTWWCLIGLARPLFWHIIILLKALKTNINSI